MSLEKAHIFDKDGLGIDMTVCFNPKELKIGKTTSWTPLDGSVNDEPTQVFGKPTPATLSVTLQFDTYESKVSVYAKYVQQLERLTQIMKDKKTSPDMARPPMCVFNWKHFVFAGVITSLDQTYTMFLEDGTPVRCDCTISMAKARATVTGDSKTAKAASAAAKKDGATTEPFINSTPLWTAEPPPWARPG